MSNSFPNEQRKERETAGGRRRCWVGAEGEKETPSSGVERRAAADLS